MLFKILSLQKTAKAWRENPQEEVAGITKGAIVGYLLTTFVVTFLILGVLGILAFTTWIGGPYGIAKVLFFIVAVPLSLALITLHKILKTLQKMIRGVGQSSPQPKEASVIDVTIDEKDA